MYFHMPTKVYCETDCVRAHAKELASFREKGPDRHRPKQRLPNGSIADVQAALSVTGCRIPFSVKWRKTLPWKQ